MAYASFKDSNVLFLQGSQINLNNLISAGGAKEGAFYLTNDTHRLYVGRNNGTKVIPVAVNEGVVTVAAVANLPTSGVNAGEFYYATKENILCVYNGQQFIQINKDANTVNNSMTAAVAAAGNGAKVTHTVTDSDGNPVVADFTIQDADGTNIISINGRVIDIKGDVFSLSTTHADNNLTIKLDSANTDNTSSVVLKGGSNVTIAADGTISSEYHNTVNNSAELKLNSTGTITMIVTDSDGESVQATSGAIKYTVGTQEYVPGQTLPVYTKDEIETKLKGLNGMTYKGTTTAIPTGSIASGDTYMVTGDSSITIPAASSYDNAEFVAKKGDLIIATGTETNGVLSAVKWSYVPSGDDAQMDTTYTWTATAGTNKIVVTNDDSSDAVGGIELKAGTAMAVASTAPNGNSLSTTISHADVSNKQTTGEAVSETLKFNAVTGVAVNAQGHVTEVITKEINIVDSTYEIKNPTATTATVPGKASAVKLTTALDSNNEASQSALTITSNTVALTAGTNAYNVDIVWGEF